MSPGSIKDPAYVMDLRREIYSKPSVARTDLVGLIQAGQEAADGACGEFIDLLTETGTNLLVDQSDPPRYVQGADADWLIAGLKGARLGQKMECRLLLALLTHAVSVPANLVAFTVAEIERAIASRGHVAPEDLDALRTAVYAPTEGSSLHVNRDSAEALLRVAHETANVPNADGFDDFAAKAVGNYLMGVAFHWTPAVGDEKELEAWLDEKPTLGSFLKGMFAPRPPRVASLEDKLRAENLADAKEIADAKRLSPSEADWLLAHLTREGPLTGCEVKLLELLKTESGPLPPALAAALDRRAA